MRSEAERTGSWCAAWGVVVMLGGLGCSSDEAGAEASEGIASSATDTIPGETEATSAVSSTGSADGSSTGPAGITSSTSGDDDDGDDDGSSVPPVVLVTKFPGPDPSAANF